MRVPDARRYLAYHLYVSVHKSCALQEYDAAFTPGKGKLTRLLLYVLDPSQHARPPNIPEAQWQFALRKAGGPNNAARVWPVAVQGSGQLKEHRDAQQKGAEANRAYLSELHGVIQRLAADEEHELRRRAALVLRTHAELAHRLLKVRTRCFNEFVLPQSFKVLGSSTRATRECRLHPVPLTHYHLSLRVWSLQRLYGGLSLFTCVSSLVACRW